MGWFLANGFLFLLVIIVAGYVWCAFFLLRLIGMQDNPFSLIAGFSAALIAAYFTMKGAHALLNGRV